MKQMFVFNSLCVYFDFHIKPGFVLTNEMIIV